MVHESKGLKGSSGGSPARFSKGRVGNIEICKDINPSCTGVMVINSPAVSIGAMHIKRDISRNIVLLIFIKSKAWATHFEIKFARNAEDGIADFLGLHPTGREAPKVSGVAINAGSFGIENRGLLIGLRCHEKFVERFQMPTFAHKFCRKPIEKFGVGGPTSHETKITGSINNACAEMIMPNSIGKHTGGERVIVCGNPIGHCQPAFAFGFSNINTVMRRIGCKY